ncbi:AMP-binding protein [Candidatus Poribacteria bacterium]
MSAPSRYASGLARHVAVRARCMHPTGIFTEFRKEEIEQSIPERFEQQAVKYPDRLAVKSRDHEFTYDELNKLANRIAGVILTQSGRGNEPVALLMEKGAPVIAAILGVLKAGKTGLVLDPSSPPARTAYMLEESQASLIVTNSKNFSLASGLAHDAHHLLNIDKVDSSQSTENLRLSLLPETLAFIIYTSGSTGHPKGVVHNHRNMLHTIMNFTNDMHISREDRELSLISHSSMAGLWFTFLSLLNGASTFPFDIREEGLTYLANWMIQQQITIFNATMVLRQFASTMTGVEKFPSIRIVSAGGDSIYRTDVDIYRRLFPPDCVFGVGLGTTETAHIRWNMLDKETEVTEAIVPPGYPVADMEVMLLDDAGEEVGTNKIGEIAVKSRYLALGYWRKPDLTRSTFLPDPEGGDKRIYRTGDLGIMHPDGCLVHLGRKDFQVKIRGYRVEIAETESALLSLDNVKEALVEAREDQPGERRLVAYLVPKRQPAPTVTKLRRMLAKTLPDYMIPSAFVMMDAMSLTATNKIDRLMLPEPGTERPELDTPFVAPRTPTEETLAAIWAEVLRLEQVGIEDSFFDLGGHSLLATRIVSRTIREFQVDMPLRAILQSSTVADMAAIIAQNQATDVGNEDIDRMLSELEALSDEEIRQLVDNAETE